MMYNRKSLSLSLFLSFAILPHTNTFATVGHSNKPEVGKPCPPFTLSHVTHFPKSAVTLNDFKGKWLFLDFWYTGCANCISILPEIDKWQKEFRDRIQFMLVGCVDNKRNRNIENFYEKRREKEGLDLAAAYDSVISVRWNIRTMPHMILIDPQGIVRYITDGRDMTSEKIEKLLNGHQVSFYEKDKVRKRFEVPLKNDEALYHSVLTKWKGEAFQMGSTVEEYVAAHNESEDFQLAGASLNRLYNIAYFGQGSLMFVLDPLYGKVYPFPVLEIKDPAPFQRSIPGNYGKGLYNYSLRLNAKQISREKLMQYIQEDLARVFQYNAQIETRDMPVWRLVAKPGVPERITTKGGVAYNGALDGNAYTGFSVRNTPMGQFTRFLFSYLNIHEKDPFIDDTGITSNVDLTIDADMMDTQDVRLALQKYGLDLIKSTETMKTLIIRE